MLQITHNYPKLALTVTFSERFVDLIEEGIDLVIHIGELADSSGLVASRLAQTGIRLSSVLPAQYVYVSGNAGIS